MKALIKYLFTAFEEGNGQLSMMRIIVFIIALTGCAGFFYLLHRQHATVVESGMVIGIISAALTAKAVQANIEAKTIDESKLDV